MLIDNIMANADVRNQQYRIFLCKMNKSVIRELTAQTFKPVYSPQLGGCDSFSFSIPKKYDGENVQNYNDIQGKNLIRIQQKDTIIGYFEIQNVEIKNDGISEIKSVECMELEIKLINKQLYLTTGTFKLVNNTDPTKGLLNIITNKAKSWSIGYIDSDLLLKERYFDISSVNCYQLLMETIQQSFECVVIFDSINNTINCYKLSSFGNQSPVIVSLDNIVKDADITVVTNEVVTRLYLYGDNELSVYDVNLGQPYIQNFSYYKNLTYMSQGLINALNLYDAKVLSYVSTYQNYLAQLQSLNAQLVTLNSDLLILEGQLSVLQEQKSYLESIQQSLVSINTQIASKNTEITNKNNQITSVNNQINSINSSINNIMIALDMSNNFTTAQLKELDQFIIEDTYQDSTYLATDSFTYQQKINVENQLLQAGKDILGRVSYPRYRININLIDFLKNKEFSYWWDKLHIGDIIRVQIDDTFTTTVRVTGYVHDWDSNELEIQFGDKYQLDNADIQLKDLLNSAVSAGTSINFNKYNWQDTTNTVNNEILNFINSSIDLSKNSIVGGNNIETLIDPSGALFRRWDSNINNYSPQQLRISNGAIVLSDDSFNTAKTAIGRLANGLYGIAAEVVAGKMILGNNMIIETGSGDFRVDGNGVSITKMSLNMTSTNNLNKIILDPNNGFKIQTRPNISSSFTDKFYVDTLGNLQFAGNLNGASGTFSGTVSAGSIIGSSISGGSINIGSGKFTVDSNGNLTATGANIIGNIYGSNITGSSFVGGSINISGSLSDIYISDGEIDFSNGGSSITMRYNSFDNSIFINGKLNTNSLYTPYINSDQGQFTTLTVTSGGVGYFNDLFINNQSVAIINDIVNYAQPIGNYARTTGQLMSLQVFNSKLEVFVNGSYVGRTDLTP